MYSLSSHSYKQLQDSALLQKMKPSQISLLLILTLPLLLTSATTTTPPVLDINGHELHSGARYYILPVIRGRGGGLTLSFTGRVNTTVSNCPLDVVQERSEIKSGHPVSFTPTSGGGVIRESTDLNIKFWAATTCVQSTVWKLAGFDEATKRYFITTGGVEGKPGVKTLSNWFKIEKINNENLQYKLVFCPMVCKFCKVICKDLGFYIDGNGYRRMVLTDDFPLELQFKKA